MSNPYAHRLSPDDGLKAVTGQATTHEDKHLGNGPSLSSPAPISRSAPCTLAGRDLTDEHDKQVN